MKKYTLYVFLTGVLLLPTAGLAEPEVRNLRAQELWLLDAIDLSVPSCGVTSLPTGAGLLISSYTHDLANAVNRRDPASVQAEYNAWAADGRLQVLHRLIRLAVEARAQRPEWFAGPRCWNNIVNLERFLSQIASVEITPRQYEPGSDTKALYRARWIFRFVEPYPGIPDKLRLVEGKISYYEQRVALAREVESIKSQLRLSVTNGVPNAELEDRIARLPAQEREAVEQLRKQYLDEKAQELAKAQAERERVERALRRQKELDQAIAWRKEEIDTGRPNPTAEAQRQRDPKLAEAVATWEQGYRKELAERRAEEARRLLAEKRREAEERFNATTAGGLLLSQMRTLQSERDEAARQLQQIQSQHPFVTIVGKIKDRERNAILVWGRALASGGTDPRTFGVLLQEGNIIVLNPQQERITPLYYTGGSHYFLRKDSGSNAFGVNVPVWVYGDKPLNLRSAEAKLGDVERRYRELEQYYHRMKQEYISKMLGSAE